MSMSRVAGAAPAERLLASWRARVAGRSLRVVFADGDDERTVLAAVRLHEDATLRAVLVGEPGGVRRAAQAAGIRIPDDLPVQDPAAAAHDSSYVDALARILGAKAPTAAHLRELVADPVYMSALMMRLGHADACVGGSTRPTADVLGVGLRVIGRAPGTETVSSCFLMVLPDGKVLGYGDCVVLPEPSAEQLADVAISTAATFARLTGAEPVVALLSFSTMGSASHPSIARIRRAVELVRRRAPGLTVDGELQFDAAYVAPVGRVKAPGSAVAGRANVLIFPDLAAGNIGYKITERLAGATALGPVLQGFAAPFNDVSRGADADGIAAAAVLTAMQVDLSTLAGEGPLAGQR